MPSTPSTPSTPNSERPPTDTGSTCRCRELKAARRRPALVLCTLPPSPTRGRSANRPPACVRLVHGEVGEGTCPVPRCSKIAVHPGAWTGKRCFQPTTAGGERSERCAWVRPGEIPVEYGDPLIAHSVQQGDRCPFGLRVCLRVACESEVSFRVLLRLLPAVLLFSGSGRALRNSRGGCQGDGGHAFLPLAQ